MILGLRRKIGGSGLPRNGCPPPKPNSGYALGSMQLVGIGIPWKLRPEAPGIAMTTVSTRISESFSGHGTCTYSLKGYGFVEGTKIRDTSGYNQVDCQADCDEEFVTFDL